MVMTSVVSSLETVTGYELTAGMLVDGRYRLEALATRGPLDRWSAWDDRLQRRVTVALFEPDRPDVERDLRKAHQWARISHPALTNLFDAGITDVGDAPGIAVRAFVVTELLAGTSLRHRVALAHLPHRRLARAASQVADALARLHAVGLVHGAVTADAITLRSDDGAAEARLPGRP